MRSFTEDCPFFYYVVKTQYYLLLYHTFTCFATSIRNFYYFFRTNLHYFLFLQSLINYLTIILRCDIITKDFWLNIDFGVWLSLVERLVRDQEAVCSSHITPTSINARKPCIHAVSGRFCLSVVSGAFRSWPIPWPIRDLEDALRPPWKTACGP